MLVQRTGSEEARERNEMEAAGYGPPRRPKRGYHGKRDLTPREDRSSATGALYCSAEAAAGRPGHPLPC